MAKAALLQDARQNQPLPMSLSFYPWLGGAQSLTSLRWHHRATTIQLGGGCPFTLLIIGSL